MSWHKHYPSVASLNEDLADFTRPHAEPRAGAEQRQFLAARKHAQSLIHANVFPDGDLAVTLSGHYHEPGDPGGFSYCTITIGHHINDA